MTNADYNTLQCRIKALQGQVDRLISGKEYQKLREQHSKDVAYYCGEIDRLKKDLEASRKETIRVREIWFKVFNDLLKENEKSEEQFGRRLREMESRALKVEKERDDLKDRLTELRREYYNKASILEDEQDKNRKLLAQLNRDFENSSIPSSKARKPGKIQNSREKTGRAPGGQPGHEGHRRKKQPPTSTQILPPPQEVLDDPSFRKTGRTISKQQIGLKVFLEVKEYMADIYYNPKTNEYSHSPFPEGLVNEVNYDGSIKAFLYLLNTECNVSIDKCRKFLSDLTGGQLNISKGMINGLAAEFAKRSEEELSKACSDFLLAPVMHADNTVGRVNGENVFIHVCALPDGRALYFFNRKKGHEGVKSTLLKDYQGIIVHDHDTTYYSYGSKHQECCAHILRYLKNSMENEPERNWNKEMHTLIQEMVHYRNSLLPGADPDVEKVVSLENRYDAILSKAREEYEYDPPGAYFKDGYNLYRRMEKYRDNHLLFLHDTRVPATNNEAERHLRNYKRKQAQAVSFRSSESVEALCKGMSCLVLMRQKDGDNLMKQVAEAFGSH